MKRVRGERWIASEAPTGYNRACLFQRLSILGRGMLGVLLLFAALTTGGKAEAQVSFTQITNSTTASVSANTTTAVTIALTPTQTEGSCLPTSIPIGTTVSDGSLNDSDCTAPHRSAKADLYTFTGSAGQVMQIAMNRGSLGNPYLILVGPNGTVVAQDDDSGGNLNALISNLPLPSSGTYTIEATASSSGDRGTYTLILASYSSIPSPPTTGALQVTVRRSDTNAALSGATVLLTGGPSLGPTPFLTGSSGQVTFSNLPTDTYTVTASLTGFQTNSTTASVSANATTSASLSLTPSTPDLAEGLVAYYPFNGNANDESGNENHGTIYGATLIADRFGRPNRAYSFDGVDDYINVGSDASLKMKDGLTISAWINMASYSSPSPNYRYQNIISDHAPNETTEGPGKYLRFDYNKLQFLVGGIYGWGTGRYVEYPFDNGMLGQWQHVVGTYDRKMVRLYLNGVQVDSRPYTEQLTINSNPILIGHSGFGEYLHGIVDDVRIYNRALSETEIQALYSPANTPPTANAGADQTKDEGSVVTLNGLGSSDPDGDPLVYSWTQLSGPVATLSDPSSPAPSFTAPLVNAGGATLTFQLTVSDGLGGRATDEVAIAIFNMNDPPACGLAQANPTLLWPPNHKLVPVGITGVSDPNNDQVTMTVTSVTQDEAINGLGDGDTSPDAVMQGNRVLLRAERAGGGNGRVYQITFTAVDDSGDSCMGSVIVCVPHDRATSCVNDGQLYNSLQP